MAVRAGAAFQKKNVGPHGQNSSVPGSHGGHHKLRGISTRLIRLRFESCAHGCSKTAGVMFQIAL